MDDISQDTAKRLLKAAKDLKAAWINSVSAAKESPLGKREMEDMFRGAIVEAMAAIGEAETEQGLKWDE